VPCEEPYAKRTAQGLILGPDGEKMSKSRGNVVDPNVVVEEFGADVLRLYILFMGDYEKSAPWSENSVRGCKRFLERVAGMTDLCQGTGESKLASATHKLVKKVTSDIDNMKFNTAIAAMMAYVNEVYEAKTITKDELSVFVRLLDPFAPHLCEEIWCEFLGNKGLCAEAEWPTYDESKTVDSVVEMAVQVNGKLRATVTLPIGSDKDTVLAAAMADARVSSLVEGKTVIKEILVPNKILNIVVK
jgi:leucyl-tRNA synthetase